MTSETTLTTFAIDVARDLALAPKQLQSKYLYDGLGSRLFEAICRLPWYTITRAELGLLARHAREIAAELPDGLTVTELGPGDGEKIAVLAAALVRERRALATHLIDISQSALDRTENRLGRYEGVSVVGHRASYEEGLRRVGRMREGEGALLVLFLGSNIGNFDRAAAADFLRAIRGTLRAGDALLLGADLVKPEKDLILAYDDPLGITAAFDKNLLLRINRELGGDFDLSGWEHRAVFDPIESRVEMRLVSLRDQEVEIPAAGTRVRFTAGEHIWTESSYKYTAADLRSLVEGAGFGCRRQWMDPEAQFALALHFAA